MENPGDWSEGWFNKPDMFQQNLLLYWKEIIENLLYKFVFLFIYKHWYTYIESLNTQALIGKMLQDLPH